MTNEHLQSSDNDNSDASGRDARDANPARPSVVPRLDRRVWLIVVASLLFVLFLAYLLWPTKKAAGEADEAADVVVSVKVAKAERGTISSELAVLGTIFAREQAIVSPKINGQIRSVALLKNKRVRAGEIVATLESRDLQAQRAEAASAVSEAESNLRLLTGGTIPEANAQDDKALRDARANVANAKATYERRLTLFERGGISKKDLEASQLALTTAENDLNVAETAARVHQMATNPNNRSAAAARVKQAQERLAALDTQLSYASIRAPFSGVITDQFQYEGEYVSAGAKLFAIADVSEVIVKGPVPDTVVVGLKVGDSATVLPEEMPDTKLEGAISLISRASDPQSRTVEIWVNLKNEDGRLRAGSAAKILVTTSTATDAIVIPASAVTLEASNSGEGTVMVVDENSVAHETKVTVGIHNPDQVEITSGLKEGDTVVTEGNYALPDGTKVEVASEGEEKEESSGGGGESNGKSAGSEKEPGAHESGAGNPREQDSTSQNSNSAASGSRSGSGAKPTAPSGVRH